ncbi:MAG: hypothetical protein M2R45_03513 [Verrucomicrobia subdivision 3 bacterium]|nr:hypothetical protein [Limisphaerales bacterium]MCS1415909.1 hypothetical protein [Limisphaerales bacterium]
MSADVERISNEQHCREGIATLDEAYVREKIEEEVWILNQIVKPKHLRKWEIDFDWRYRLVDDKSLHLRLKFYTAQASESENYPTL